MISSSKGCYFLKGSSRTESVIKSELLIVVWSTEAAAVVAAVDVGTNLIDDPEFGFNIADEFYWIRRALSSNFFD